MSKYINGIFRRLISNTKLIVKKIIYKDRLEFRLFENLSVSTSVNIEGSGKISLNKNVSTKKNVQFNSYGSGEICIGSNCFFNDNCRLDCKGNIQIGDNCRFGPNVIIYDHDHDIKSLASQKFDEYVTSPVSIGRNSWIGAGAIILKGCTVGENCVVGAGVVLTKSISDNTVVTQKIDYRYKEVKI